MTEEDRMFDAMMPHLCNLVFAYVNLKYPSLELLGKEYKAEEVITGYHETAHKIDQIVDKLYNVLGESIK